MVLSFEKIRSYIKIIRVINFLSKKNYSVRFQLNFVSFNFSGILFITVQYSSSRVALDTDSQSVPSKIPWISSWFAAILLTSDDSILT